MPLYEIAADGLLAFRQLRGGAELYEQEIERLLWENLQDLTGEVLLRVARQPAISSRGRPDIIALDPTGSVVIIEVKREVDRTQLAQSLEYAGWARTSNLDELAGLYHEGTDAFWVDWKNFTDTEHPRRVTKRPRLILVARDFDLRTESALDFLRDNNVPITVIRIGLYEDVTHRRFLDIEGVDEPEPYHEPPAMITGRSSTRITHQVAVADLLGAGMLSAGDELVWRRPRVGLDLRSVVLEDGRLRLPDGRVFASLSGAAVAAAGGGSFDGWEAWRTVDGRLLRDLRAEYLALDEPRGGDEAPHESDGSMRS